MMCGAGWLLMHGTGLTVPRSLRQNEPLVFHDFCRVDVALWQHDTALLESSRTSAN